MENKIKKCMTTISIREKDSEYLEKLREKLKVRGKGVIVEKIIRTIKWHKMEKELK